MWPQASLQPWMKHPENAVAFGTADLAVPPLCRWNSTVLGNQSVSTLARGELSARTIAACAGNRSRLPQRDRHRCDAIVAPSESMAQLLREQRMNYDVGIWTRGIDRDIFNPERRDLAWRRSMGIEDDAPVIGFIGRLVMEKGLDVFSDTVDRLSARHVRHRVLVVGEGPAREWFQNRLPGGIFTGFQTGADLGRAVASMDMLFNPSVTETFGNVTLEAMACALPTVAARATGSESLVTEGVTGRLLRPGAIEDFADALQTYCLEAEVRQRAGQAARARAERNGWDQVNQALVDTYLRLIRQRSHGLSPRSSPVP